MNVLVCDPVFFRNSLLIIGLLTAGVNLVCGLG